MFTYCKDILTVRDVSMILPCFVFLRFNEVCELLVSYISFYSDYKILRMRHSKTDVYREDRNVKISKGSTRACPVLLLQRYTNSSDLRPNADMYSFRPACRSGCRCFRPEWFLG